MVIKQSIKRVDVLGSQKDNTKELLLKRHKDKVTSVFFRRRGPCEFTQSASNRNLLEDIQIFEPKLILVQLVILWYSHRENRERRIGIDRVKDAVEKCLQQVAESWRVPRLTFFQKQVRQGTRLVWELPEIDQRAPCDSKQIFSWTWSNHD